MTQQQEFVGIDVSKAQLDVAIWPTGETFQVSNDREGRAELVHRLKRRSIAAVGFEASGGYERDLFKALLAAGLPARRVNAFRVRQFARACGYLAKNDRIDAVVIARFVDAIPQKPVERNDATDALAELVTARRQLQDELTRVLCQAERSSHIVTKRLAKRRIARIRADILLLDKTIASTVADNPDFASKDQLLQSVPGVGPIVARTMIALMPELGSLSNRQAASLLGVAPFDCESGRYRGQRRIAGGRRAPRDVAYMAALVAARHNPTLSAFAQRLRAAGKKPKVVIIAVCRKLITTLNAILRAGTPWTNNPNTALG